VVLFERNGLIFVTYGLFAAAGAFVSLTWLSVLLLMQGLTAAETGVLIGAGCLGVLLMSRLFALVLDYRLLLRDPARALRSVAFVSWGGIIAVALTAILFSLATGHTLLPLLDAIAVAGPAGHAIGRLGCIAYGCCHGRPAAAGPAVRYFNPQAKAVRVSGLRGVPLHPVPLYEGALILALFIALNALYFAGVPAGVPTAAYFAGYGAIRFGTEFLRDNTSRYLRPPFALNHALSTGLVLCGAVLLPAVLVSPTGSGVSFSFSLGGLVRVLPVLSLACLFLFAGFAVHRNRVGEW
jgi:phosphatidylglycerol:prolipoprotein diacylglycerol transferase